MLCGRKIFTSVPPKPSSPFFLTVELQIRWGRVTSLLIYRLDTFKSSRYRHYLYEVLGDIVTTGPRWF